MLSPIGAMYGIFTYIWLILIVNVGKYTSPMDPMVYSTNLKHKKPEALSNLEDGDGDSILSDDSANLPCGSEEITPQRSKGRFQGGPRIQ